MPLSTIIFITTAIVVTTIGLLSYLTPKKDGSGPGLRCWIGLHPYSTWKQEQGKSWTTLTNPVLGLVYSGWTLVKRRECRHCGNIQRRAIDN